MCKIILEIILKRISIIILLFLLFPKCYSQKIYTISGRIEDGNNQPLAKASILIKGSVVGTTSEKDGSFSLKTSLKPPFTLIASFIGYRRSEHIINEGAGSINISLESQTILADEIIVTASRLEEASLKSPVSIEQLETKDLKISTAPTFFESLESVKGVQTITASLGFKVFNTKGFTNPTNVRFLQLVDGVDNQAPVIGASIANAVGPTELDIERIEVVPGTASALYGMNAINGLANFFTKDPFKYQGLSFYQRTGVNHINDAETKAHLLSETAIRYAKSFNNRFAFKINMAYSKGYDWVANQQTDLNPNANVSVGLTGEQNPANDPVNSYGNESPNQKTLSLNGRNYVVARTGYFEKDITNYTLENLKTDIALHYKVTNKLEASYSYRIGRLDNVYQRTNRFKLDDYLVQQHSFQAKGSSINLKAYLTRELSGSSYNIRSLAENLDRSFKNDDKWFNDYRSSYLKNINSDLSVEESHKKAREFADQERYIPGTTPYDSVINKLKNINNWDIGAALRTSANIYHIEGQYDFTKEIKFINILAGFDYRAYSVTPDGNYFINPESPGKNLLYRKGGAFIQISKNLLSEKLRLNAALRYDKNEYFNGILNPRFSAVYNLRENHNIRISYQNGYRFPTLFEAFSNVNSGGVKRVGGLPMMSKGIFEDSYIRSSIDAFQAAVNTDVNKQGLSLNDAIRKNAELVKKSDYDYIKPERINSFELGYKSLTLSNRLYFDIDFYFNFYNNFIAQVEVNQIKNRQVINDSIPFYLNDRQKQDRYRLWTNSKSTVYNYGTSLGAKFNFYQKFTLGENVSYAKLHRKRFNDGLEEAFNTPTLITNVSLENTEIRKNLGFKIVWHWQESYLWQSSLGSGLVPAYQNIDAQASFSLPKQYLQIKVGGTNMLNQRYYQFVAGPKIGALYYVAFTFDGL